MSTKFWNCAVIFLIIVTLLIILKFFATKTIFYGVFYFFLTLFFIYIFVKEKKLAEIFDARREKYVSKIVKKYDIKNIRKINFEINEEKEYAELSESKKKLYDYFTKTTK